MSSLLILACSALSNHSVEDLQLLDPFHMFPIHWVFIFYYLKLLISLHSMGSLSPSLSPLNPELRSLCILSLSFYLGSSSQSYNSSVVYECLYLLHHSCQWQLAVMGS